MASENIYLFVPNLIGYVRIIFMLVSFYFMPSSPWIAVSLYLTSEFLDAFDGHAARALNQCTKFGSVLDMVTDRCSTTGLLIVLAQFYPRYQVVFQFLVVLDIFSHWVQVYSNLLTGTQSHKTVAESGNAFLKLYYKSRAVLFTMCAGNELFFAMLYLLHFSNGPSIFGFGLWKVVACIAFPISLTKNVLNIVQLVNGFKAVADIDIKDRTKKN
ncbi:CDP-diacylglycerol--inositol 3-phosphatidyltransferase-like [Hydra vulgaris]|uniref:CDP-diacylglycerol--inositol 3-phosphatidyltransferase n=1 Tax=Hydra vulgaris TaxID=6087 RepID=A0ABM4CN58_HYDVU